MHEGPPIIIVKSPELIFSENLEERMGQRNERKRALVSEIRESQEYFSFPGIDPESYRKMKSVDDEFSGLTTPVDELIKRFNVEGIKVVLGKNPDGCNVFVLPLGSDDIEHDSISPKQLNLDNVTSQKLKELIMLDRS